MEQNPYESPREARGHTGPKAIYLPALLLLLSLVVLASAGLAAYLRSLRMQQSAMPKTPVLKLRAVSSRL